MTTRAGEPTAALYGFSALLLKLLREERPKGIAFARDAPVQTFRHERYAQYKAHRPGLPDALRPQFARLTALLDAVGAPVFCTPGFEADDVLATLAAELRAAGEHVRIVTGDRDLFPTVGEGVDVLFVGRRGDKPVVYDADAVVRRFGIRPTQLPAYMALVGDSSDNLPGVRGIGPRTAARLVRAYGDIAILLEHLEDITPPSLRESLRGAAASMQSNEDLARLRKDVPLEPSPRFAPLTEQARARIRELFVALEFQSLLERLDKLTL
jgi:DNA polymerase-1